MRIDIEDLRRHYADLSDEALLEIQRGDLTETAQTCYDDELRRRGLDRGAPAAIRASRPQRAKDVPASDAAELESAEEPEWLDDAAEVFSHVDRPGSTAPAEAAQARDALAAAGIPVYVELSEDPPEEPRTHASTRRWRVLVPGNLNMRATGVLECEIFNEEFESAWRAHLEGLPDDDLEGANPEVAFAGLIDKLERATRLYEEELARRGLNS
jgi:hypothetical protein